MKNFIYQVQCACDFVKNGAAWLSEQTPPSYADDETTIDDLRARIQKTINFAEGIKGDLYANADSQRVKISWLPNRVVLGKNYLLQVIVPNVFFHVGMAYAILRSNGVDMQVKWTSSIQSTSPTLNGSDKATSPFGGWGAAARNETR